MNKAQYRKARRMCRDNGRAALKWLPPAQAAAMQRIVFTKPADLLAERADCFETMGWGIHLSKSIARHHAAIRAAA